MRSRGSRSRCASARSSTWTILRWCARSSPTAAIRRANWRRKPCATCARRWGLPISDSLTARSAAFETDMSFHLTLDNPSAWVRRFAPHIPVGRVLDLACGTCCFAKLLASLGQEVTAVDRDAQALAVVAAAAPGIHTLRIVLDNGFNADMASLFAAGSFAGIVVTI